MNTLKFFNILLLTLIITLVMQLMIGPRPQNIAENSIALTTSSKTSTLPNLPAVTLHNTTDKDFVYNNCENITFIYSPATSANRLSPSAENCQDVTVAAKSTATIDLSRFSEIIIKNRLSGDFELQLSKDDVERKLSLTVEHAGFFKSFVTTLIYNPIYNLFVGLLMVVPAYSLGWAIIAITIIIRIVLLYPQHRMLENGRKLAELNPKIRALQKEYENDRATLGMKMMELYKKEGVNPMGSCLPLLIQLPIFYAVLLVLTGITDVANTYHLYPFFSHFNPENIEKIFFGQNLLQVGGTAAIVLMIVLMATQFLQSWLAIKAQPPLPKAEPKKEGDNMPTLDPRFMQGITLYFLPFIVGVSALFFPIGLGLYWWIGVIFMIFQQMYVNARAKKTKSHGEIVKKK